MFALSQVKQTNQNWTSFYEVTISCIAILEYRPGSFVSGCFEIHSQDCPPRSFECWQASYNALEAHLELKEGDQKHCGILSLMASWKESKRPPRPNFQWMEVYSLTYYRCGGWSPYICFHIKDEKKLTTIVFDCRRVLIFCLSQVLSLQIFWPLTLNFLPPLEQNRMWNSFKYLKTALLWVSFSLFQVKHSMFAQPCLPRTVSKSLTI